ncbi:MAG: DNA topoisomerase, partial [Firmicutes bacterium]|nr:DNA topoisomerase [Bacillota bacterium]
MKKKPDYGNDSISSLKGEDRVRKRPGVIFGSDGIDGCEHSFFEILSNSIDEAREGFGNVIRVTRFSDGSICVKDYGRGIPMEYNTEEERYNWELVFCELYAGGKYNNAAGGDYEYSLGLNGLGACATQYASEYMDVAVKRDGAIYELHFEKGKNVGGLKKTEASFYKTGTEIKWKPDLEVFTDINIPLDYYLDVLKKQAVINEGVEFILYDEPSKETYRFLYQNGLEDYLKEINEDKNFTNVTIFEHETKGRDREDKPEYKLKFKMAFCFNNYVSRIEYYHNSSFLEYGGSPDRAVKSGFLTAIDRYLRNNNLYRKDEKKIMFSDIEDSLVLVVNSFSTSTSYENQTKKSIQNKFIQEAMTDFLKEKLEIYFIENKMEADKIAAQVLANKRSRETAEKTRVDVRKKLSGNVDLNNRIEKFVNCRSKDVDKRELYIVEGDSALGACKLGRDARFQAIIPVRGKILNCLKADYGKIFNSDIITD